MDPRGGFRCTPPVGCCVMAVTGEPCCTMAVLCTATADPCCPVVACCRGDVEHRHTLSPGMGVPQMTTAGIFQRIALVHPSVTCAAQSPVVPAP